MSRSRPEPRDVLRSTTRSSRSKRARGRLVAVEGAVRADARPRARARRRDAGDRGRHRPPPPPDRRARGMLTELIAATQRERRGERQRQRERQRRGARRGGEDEEDVDLVDEADDATDEPGFTGEDPGAVAALPLPSPHGLREDDRGRRVRRGRTASRRADPHAPPPARRPVPPRPHDRGLRRAAHRRDRGGQGAAARRPADDPDLRLVRPARQRALARRRTSS